ncbi:MAG TPA: MFS transporter [Anaerolineae bacterium]|nr:MFS transporter [Anaerolineae bacterium]
MNFGELRRALATGSPIRFLLFLAFLGTFGTANFEAIFGLFMLERHGYGPEQVVGILTLVGIVAVIGRGVLTGWLTQWWGEAVVIKASQLAGAAGFVLLLLADTYVTVLLTTGLFVLITTFLRPAIHSLTSQRAMIGQGAAMGLSSSFVSLGRVAGPIWAGVIFDLNPNYPYICGAAILLLGFVLSAIWIVRDQEVAAPEYPLSNTPFGD